MSHWNESRLPVRSASVPLAVSLSLMTMIGGLASPSVSAQQWQHAIGTPREQRSDWVRQTSDRGYIAAGVTFGESTSVCDFYVTKLDASGALVWDRMLDAGVCEAANRVEEFPDGTGYLVAGERDAAADPNGVYLIKLDPAGNPVWFHAFEGTPFVGGDAGATSLDHVRFSDGWIIGGRRQRAMNRIDQAPLLIHTNTNGIPIWQNLYMDLRFGDATFASISDVEEIPGGDGFIAVGYTGTQSGDRDSFAMRLDAAGGVIWSKIYPQVDFTDYARGVEPARNGDFLVTGFTKSPGEGGGTYLMRLDPAGNLLWYETFRYFVGTQSLEETGADGDIILSGTTHSLLGAVDASLLKTDAAGNLQWTWAYGADGRDFGEAVDPTSDGGYELIGWTENWAFGSFDFYSVKTNGVGESGCNEYRYDPEDRFTEVPAEDIRFEIFAFDGFVRPQPQRSAGSRWEDICEDQCDVRLEAIGPCPGVIDFKVTGATSGGLVAYIWALGTGAFTIPGGPCAGTILGLNGTATLGGTAVADPTGEAHLTSNIGPGACGRVWVQALDVRTCCTSNVVGI